MRTVLDRELFFVPYSQRNWLVLGSLSLSTWSTLCGPTQDTRDHLRVVYAYS